MDNTRYDIITIGGGLAGASLARAMAESGAKVLVLEAVTEFKDRIRGEQMCSWGAGEARDLGIHDLLLSGCANEMDWWDVYMGQARLDHRNLRETTPQELANLAFFHPEMQEILLRAAEEAGAKVVRGARVTGLQGGSPVRVTANAGDKTETFEGDLAVGCDGRSSPTRDAAGFEVRRERDRCQIAGLLMENVNVPEDAATLVLGLMRSSVTVIFPQGGGRARTYSARWKAVAEQRFTGAKDIAPYVAELNANGLAPEVLADAEPAGPLATFDGADTWVEHPYKDGVALIGDAAAASDPVWGQGLSLTLRDVRELRDQLLAKGNPEGAGHAYAEAHDRYYSAIRDVEATITDLFFEPGEAAMQHRVRVLAAGPTTLPEMDILQSGPDHVQVAPGFRERVFGAASQN
jgi:2-polyprenyl-6-methoxyphenol hydroxylase-like FAD-dependent oxidoreductase